MGSMTDGASKIPAGNLTPRWRFEDDADAMAVRVYRGDDTRPVITLAVGEDGGAVITLRRTDPAALRVLMDHLLHAMETQHAEPIQIPST